METTEPPAPERRGKLRRRSSILKMPVPDDAGEQTEELTCTRRASRRVSFAERFHVQEFCSDEVTVTMWAKAYETEAHITDSSGEMSAAAAVAQLSAASGGGRTTLADATQLLDASMDLTDLSERPRSASTSQQHPTTDGKASSSDSTRQDQSATSKQRATRTLDAATIDAIAREIAAALLQSCTAAEQLPDAPSLRATATPPPPVVAPEPVTPPVAPLTQEPEPRRSPGAPEPKPPQQSARVATVARASGPMVTVSPPPPLATPRQPSQPVAPPLATPQDQALKRTSQTGIGTPQAIDLPRAWIEYLREQRVVNPNYSKRDQDDLRTLLLAVQPPPTDRGDRQFLRDRLQMYVVAACRGWAVAMSAMELWQLARLGIHLPVAPAAPAHGFRQAPGQPIRQGSGQPIRQAPGCRQGPGFRQGSGQPPIPVQLHESGYYAAPPPSAAPHPGFQPAFTSY